MPFFVHASTTSAKGLTTHRGFLLVGQRWHQREDVHLAPLLVARWLPSGSGATTGTLAKRSGFGQSPSRYRAAGCSSSLSASPRSFCASSCSSSSAPSAPTDTTPQSPPWFGLDSGARSKARSGTRLFDTRTRSADDSADQVDLALGTWRSRRPEHRHQCKQHPVQSNRQQSGPEHRRTSPPGSSVFSLFGRGRSRVVQGKTAFHGVVVSGESYGAGVPHYAEKALKLQAPLRHQRTSQW